MINPFRAPARIRIEADGSLEQMTLRRTTTTLAALLVLTLIAGPASAGDLKIAYVDMEKAFSTCSAGMSAKTKFTRKLEDLTRRIEGREGELTRLRGELEKSSGSLSDQTRRTRELDYQTKYRDYQRLVKDSQDDLRREDAELTSGILKTLLQVVETVGRSGGYTLVLEKKSVLYAAEQIDITDQVVASMNKMPNPVGSSSSDLPK